MVVFLIPKLKKNESTNTQFVMELRVRFTDGHRPDYLLSVSEGCDLSHVADEVSAADGLSYDLSLAGEPLGCDGGLDGVEDGATLDARYRSARFGWHRLPTSRDVRELEQKVVESGGDHCTAPELELELEYCRDLRATACGADIDEVFARFADYVRYMADHPDPAVVQSVRMARCIPKGALRLTDESTESCFLHRLRGEDGAVIVFRFFY